MLEQIKEIALKVQKYKKDIHGEQHTKNVLIEPLFKVLGFDISNPNDIKTEYTCDIGVKKGEKVDYALCRGNEAVILVEAKDCNKKLNKNNISQLFRYYSTSNAKIGILTNGIKYLFFMDTEKENTMDIEPFFVFNLLDYTDNDVAVLKLFKKEKIDYEKIKMYANFCIHNNKIHMKVVNKINKSMVDFKSTGKLGKLDKCKKLSGIVELEDFTDVNIVGTKLSKLIIQDAMDVVEYEINGWTEALLATLEYCLLWYEDKEFILSIDDSVNTKGWIKETDEGMRSPRELSKEGIYVEVHGSAFLTLLKIKSILNRMNIDGLIVQFELKADTSITH